MTEMTSKSRAERKAERKRLSEQALKRDGFEVTPYGRKRTTHCPPTLVKVVAAVTGAVLLVWHWIKGDARGTPPANEPPKPGDLKKAA